jgi:hypothetical protein
MPAGVLGFVPAAMGQCGTRGVKELTPAMVRPM